MVLKVVSEVYCRYHQGLQLYPLKVNLKFLLLRVDVCVKNRSLLEVSHVSVSTVLPTKSDSDVMFVYKVYKVIRDL